MSFARTRALAFHFALAGCCVALVSACATPSAQFARRAAEHGFDGVVVRGTLFRHVVFSRDVSRAAKRVHVYIGGDGSPARAARHDPPDPTPSADPTLDLMSIDAQPRLLLGRPCYHDSDPCDPLHFTLGRYSEDVVASMSVAIEAFRLQQDLDPNVEWVLVGFSGGGTLAILLAERLPNTRAVITLSGNLDIDAWSARHGYAPLQYSLNPSARAPLPDHVVQFHLVAARDTNVFPEFARRFIDRQPRARVVVYPEFDHGCCWTEIWPSTLRDLDVVLARDPDVH